MWDYQVAKGMLGYLWPLLNSSSDRKHAVGKPATQTSIPCDSLIRTENMLINSTFGRERLSQTHHQCRSLKIREREYTRQKVHFLEIGNMLGVTNKQKIEGIARI